MVFLAEDDHKKLQKEENHKKLQKEETSSCLLTEEALRKHNILTGASELRQFACRPCNHPWWTYVPRTKPVSSCNSCKVRYNALDREKEFGIGRYICLPCDRIFYARCEATEEHICFGCKKLTGPPYINPRFKSYFFPYKKQSSDPPPPILKIINASTPHESTGSTVESFLSIDLGPDIPVLVESGYRMAKQDYREPTEDDPKTVSPDIHFSEESHSPSPSPLPSDDDDDDSDLELQYESNLGGIEAVLSDTTSDSGKVSRKRTAASDSSDSSSSDESSDADKLSSTSSVKNSEPDSGIGTWSMAGTGSDLGTASSSTSE